MNKTEVLALLKENQNERGVTYWKKNYAKEKNGLKSFGIGLTQLRKLAKTIGRDHELAKKLWNTNYYDSKVISLLIDDPKQITKAQAEKQVGELQGGMLSHVFSSCDATLSKAPFAFELASEWIESDCDARRACGYGLLYELSKKNPKGMDDDFLLDCIDTIHEKILDEEVGVRGAMAGALMGIGKRNKTLNKAAVKVAKAIGPVDMYEDDKKDCEPFDVLKHLTSDYLKKKLAS